MKRIIIAAIIMLPMFACKKSTDSKTGTETKYYFRIEAVDNNGTSTITPYKIITVN